MDCSRRVYPGSPGGTTDCHNRTPKDPDLPIKPLPQHELLRLAGASGGKGNGKQKGGPGSTEAKIAKAVRTAGQYGFATAEIHALLRDDTCVRIDGVKPSSPLLRTGPHVPTCPQVASPASTCPERGVELPPGSGKCCTYRPVRSRGVILPLSPDTSPTFLFSI